jgi:signal transduction histidine kinase
LSISEVELSDKKIFTGIIHDISELKEVKDALKKEMELNELKSRFVTMASHEFRTPLSAILSSASLIGKYNELEDESKRLKHVNRIKSSVTNLTGILNDFLSLSKLEEGIVTVTPEEFDIVEVSKEMRDDLLGVLKEGQQIVYQHMGEDSVVTLDRNIVKNIIINFLSNAIKYSPEGKRIEFRTKLDKGHLAIVVKDEGIGIPDADKARLFGRFFRAQNAGNVPGTGLGLNIVQKYIGLLGGEISFTSQLNRGSTFEVSIPYRNVA